MNDNYLWDRSGEPDPEVERLERVLGKYRYQPKPLSPALESRLTGRRASWTRLAAVAAAVLILVAGLWIFRIYKQNLAAPTNTVITAGQDKQEKQPEPVIPKRDPEPHTAVATAKIPKKFHRKAPEEAPPTAPDVANSDSIAERMPLINPFVDVETARHIERAQLLLRSFRNTRDSGIQPDPEVLYEKQRSRGLLSKNILLRRDAEAKGNMPVGELLGTLEPFLLDIANLPDRPSNADVRSIKERMQKKEIVSALQVYAAPTLSQTF